MLDRLVTHLLELCWAGGCKELARGCAVGVFTVLWEGSLSFIFTYSSVEFIYLPICNLSISRFSYFVNEIDAFLHCF